MRFARALATAPANHGSVERSAVSRSRRPTIRRRVDPRLLALTRPSCAVAELDDPFDGLISAAEGDDAREGVEVLARPRLHLVPDWTSGRLDERSVPYFRAAPSELAAQALDPRSGFLLPLVDGRRTIAEIASVCLLRDGEVQELLRELLERDLVGLRRQRR